MVTDDVATRDDFGNVVEMLLDEFSPAKPQGLDTHPIKDIELSRRVGRGGIIDCQVSRDHGRVLPSRRFLKVPRIPIFLEI